MRAGVLTCCEVLQSDGPDPPPCSRLSVKPPVESAMKKLILTALAVTAMIWGTAAGALRFEQPATAAIDGADGWSISESGAAPGWSITPAHAHMW